ncbi:MAG: transcriptional regulator [Deltaproteobacteria bacterium]|nr:transcriptional regulator [Deltaproteobacteria bacterium]
MSKKEREVFPFHNIDKLDRYINEPARFVILTYLYKFKSAEFMELLRNSGLTQGNLSFHLKKLQDAEFIKVHKEFRNNKPLTTLSLTKNGKKSYDYYSQVVLEIIQLTQTP